MIGEKVQQHTVRRNNIRYQEFLCQRYRIQEFEDISSKILYEHGQNIST